MIDFLKKNNNIVLWVFNISKSKMYDSSTRVGRMKWNDVLKLYYTQIGILHEGRLCGKLNPYTTTKKWYI